jgi:hypothetical protein
MESAFQTPGIFSPRLLIDISYFLTACLFILGLKRTSSPAPRAAASCGPAAAVATLVSFLYPNMSNYGSSSRRLPWARSLRGGAASGLR